MRKIYTINSLKYIAAFLAVGIVSCDPEFDQDLGDRDPVATGSADFSTYVALGNSLTAGLADNSLYIDGQLASYPNILAEQMKFAGGGEFTQPLAASNAGGLTFSGQIIADPCEPGPDSNRFPKRSVLAIIDGERGVKPYSLEGAPSEVTTVIPGPFNNLGVSGAKSFHLLAPGYGNPAGVPAGTANPFFVRMASSPSTRVIDDAIAQNPTFFSLWIGNNDILDYAIAGGVTTEIDPVCGADITDIATFTGAYGGVVQAMLTATEAKGVIANLPSIASIPFFTTVPYNPIPLDAATAMATNAAYAQYNGGLRAALAALAPQGVPFTEEEVARRTINFQEGQNAVVILDESLTDLAAFASLSPALAGLAALPQLRQATPEDLLLLTSSSVIGTQAVPGDPRTTIGVGTPLEDKWVLTSAEQKEITDAQTAFNQVISGVVNQNGGRLALFDAKALLDQVSDGGVVVDGAVVGSTFATGGAFSLDGVHLTPRGNAVVANGMIDVINNNFGAALPKVQPGTYKTITTE